MNKPDPFSLELAYRQWRLRQILASGGGTVGEVRTVLNSVATPPPGWVFADGTSGAKSRSEWPEIGPTLGLLGAAPTMSLLTLPGGYVGTLKPLDTAWGTDDGGIIFWKTNALVKESVCGPGNGSVVAYTRFGGTAGAAVSIGEDGAYHFWRRASGSSTWVAQGYTLGGAYTNVNYAGFEDRSPVAVLDANTIGLINTDEDTNKWVHLWSYSNTGGNPAPTVLRQWGPHPLDNNLFGFLSPGVGLMVGSERTIWRVGHDSYPQQLRVYSADGELTDETLGAVALNQVRTPLSLLSLSAGYSTLRHISRDVPDGSFSSLSIPDYLNKEELPRLAGQSILLGGAAFGYELNQGGLGDPYDPRLITGSYYSEDDYFPAVLYMAGFEKPAPLISALPAGGSFASGLRVVDSTNGDGNTFILGHKSSTYGSVDGLARVAFENGSIEYMSIPTLTSDAGTKKMLFMGIPRPDSLNGGGGGG